MLAAGLASGVHCVGMCGGIVAAFDLKRVIPIREENRWGRRLAFNCGRVCTYAAAGALAGSLGAAVYAAVALPAQAMLQFAACAMLVLVGLYLVGAERVFAPLEALGAPLWRRLQPLAARLLSAPTLARAYLAGLAWGWLPCAMVYAALAAAALAGGAARGALAMLAFGLGTLPFLLGAGWLAARLRAWRRAAGAALLAFGVAGFAHAEAGALGEGVRRILLCF
ncbi:MAG: sulfite exporter TauE/SafE family protein [Burkholderiales bacterium]|nr:sulfite exporter TauE/SafE family protein [Burkholderiales bacterium]